MEFRTRIRPRFLRIELTTSIQADGESLKGQLALAADEADELRFRLTTAQSAADKLRDMQAELRAQLAQARHPRAFRLSSPAAPR